MKHFVKYFFLCVMFACQKPDVKPQTTPASDRTDALRVQFAATLERATAAFDQTTGWPSASDCDGLLWAGLASAAGMKTVKYALAEYAPGEMHRRPWPSCWAGFDNGSQTTISRDMLVGYMWALWANRDVEGARRLAKYGEEHGWKMGSPIADGRVVLSGNGIGILGRLVKKLDGGDKPYRHIQPVFSKVERDYEQHLLALQITLNGEIDEGLDRQQTNENADAYPGEVVQTDITSSQAKLIEWLATEADPKNQLFLAAHATYNTGDFNGAIDALLAEPLYVPPYVRGHENYLHAHWLFAAKMVLARIK